ncbi:MAG: CHAD domain-containing protein [Acidimicrobiales bacterium]|nr:CHAD domain-containing protein [Acidimicrobiales bacterium]
MTVPATASAPYSAPFQVEPRLQLGRSEPLAEGVKRVVLDELERAAAGFFEPEENFHDAVHGARESIIRVRSLLHVVRDELGPKAFAFEDRFLRDTAGMLAEVRSAVAVTDATSLIRDLYGDFLADGTFDATVQGLRRRRDIVTLKTMEDPHLIGQVVNNLERAYNRYRTWPADPDVDYGITIRDSYEAIAPGLGSTYEEGRRLMVAAYRGGAGDGFNEWRKRVKVLRHQLEFLMPLWPEVLVGLVYTLDTLGALLGEDHDHADLLDLLRQRTDLCSNPRERSLLFALVTQRRSELRLASEILGRRVYADHPDSFTHRFGEYWASRAQALAAPLETLSVH